MIVVQAQCDLPEQERLRPPVDDKALDAFPFKKVVHYSAKENRGRAALDEALAEAVQWLRRKQGVAVIGKGRAAVKVRLEEIYREGKQLVSQDEFKELCEEVGNVSSPPLLLDYLHNIGTVFYQEDLFGDAIILDQAWALDAVYAVFHRNGQGLQDHRAVWRALPPLPIVAEWVWQKHSEAEQELFLSFMRQCGICFTYRRGDREVEAEYIAPDLLPTRNDPAIAEQLRQKWDEGCDAEATLTYELLPPGLMRSLISRVGEEAGLSAEYWRDGFSTTGRRARVRLSSSVTPETGRAKSISGRTARAGEGPAEAAAQVHRRAPCFPWRARFEPDHRLQRREAREVRKTRRSRPRPNRPPKRNIASPMPGATKPRKGASAKSLSMTFATPPKRRASKSNAIRPR